MSIIPVTVYGADGVKMCPYRSLTQTHMATETTKQAVSDVFDRGILPTEEPVRYYYNPNYCNSPAHEQKSYVLTSAGCRFFKD